MAHIFCEKGDNMKNFRHLVYGDRVAMETLLNRGSSKADIARYLGVSRATITREYKKVYISILQVNLWK